ncbi:Tudor/PWWP/MBT superfamily protein [Corchorus olitorius]|uniref:Glutathione peroxidase n=1 Tax=Corchorus olitorius TaxID=93759 RepID=A0A1R3KD21_9ROSI|nr:Tudor/PWWP/MBT superfamily protein [Corchorus olitorius]
MAPSRRKGASKAAAAAAARRQWKVGDLVLAKVKGFPAWPATVSEPEKWGYSSDWKKVLVYFFGTQQIAFCNPADVEAFTEEKKQSLLTKRQGKGADFVRAVQEIIDSYEKSKKQDEVVDYNSADRVAEAKCGNSVDSSASKDLNETHEATVELRIKTSNADTNQSDPSVATEVAPAEAKTEALHEKEVISEQPPDKVLVKETPVLTTYSSRKRSGGLRSQKSASQQKAPPVRRVRSSSRVESSRFQNFMTSNDVTSGADVSANGIHDVSLRKNKRVRKSTDASESDDVDSSVLLSNGSTGDNGSEIATIDSDAVSLNDGSTMDSSCKPEHSETVVECSEGDVELSKGLDFQIKAVVIKKKRKPLRKRVNHDSAEPSVRMDAEADVDLGANSSRQNLRNMNESSNERYAKDDGDEHLPLVKRARVRMGKLLATDEELTSSSPTEEKPVNEGAVNSFEQMSPSSSCRNDSPADRDSLARGALVSASPSKVETQVHESRLEPWKVMRNQLGCLAGGEAALPPSKRLHRALEAMSANAAEEDQACAEHSPAMKLDDDRCNGSPIRSCSHATVDDKDTNGLEQYNMDLPVNSDSGILSTSSPTPLEILAQSSLEPDICNESAKIPTKQKHEFHKDVSECVNHFSHDADEDQNLEHKNRAILRPTCDSSDEQLPSKDDSDAEPAGMSNFRAENPDEQFNMSEHDMNSDPVAGTEENGKISPQDGSNACQCTTEHTSREKSDSAKSQTDESSLVNSMSEVPKELQPEQNEKATSSLICDANSEKDVVVVRLSPSSADRVDSPARVSPSNASICHTSTSESANIIRSNGYCSPNIHSSHNKSLYSSVADDEGKADTAASERPKSVSKCNNYTEAHVALASFENTLGSLTRTKESIARATRIAIDCAKFGVSAKVLEIVARSLERESSLHRRVDLFFLVDSIAQCSRGLKGDVCGIYPSAIQASLPRLLSAAAPPGSSAQENRRQCLKVLRLWLERRILPESVIRHHIRELDSLSASSSGGAFSRRSARTSRTERSLDDPIRDMEGMHVDEYGSNSSFQLPGFCMPRMLKDEDEGSDSDGESFEAVTPEHCLRTPDEKETNTANEKRRHILEDVDGELEMEDVAPEIEMTSSGGIGVNIAQTSHDQNPPLPFAPPLPHDVPPSSPPLPSSPPPPAPPPPPPPPSIAPHCPISDPFASGVDSAIHTSIHNRQDGTVPPSVAPRMNSTMCNNAVPYHGPESRDLPCPMQVSDCNTSFNGYPVHPVNNIQQLDGPNFHHNSYPPRPPHPSQTNQFSYVNSGQHMNSMRDAPPPPYPNRYYSPNVDGGNYYNSHERMKLAPNEPRESWRLPPPPFSGPRYDDKVKASYGHGSYGGGPQCEPTRMPNQGWGYHPPAMNHRNSFPVRPPPEGAVPVGSRGRFRSVRAWYLMNSKGQDVDLSIYKGKVLLVVNVASKCGFTDVNYTQLTDLYSKYRNQGLEILAFPCNQFLKQEPGSSQEAEEFACTRYQAEYPIFRKVRVNGPNTEPVYKFLKSSKSGFLGSRVKWNFTKFLVDKDGHVIGRYGPTTAPLAIEADIKKAMEADA